MQQDLEIKTGIPADAMPEDWMINEMLFNPRSNAYDFIECVNNSANILDVAKLFLANRDNNGNIASIKSVSEKPHYILPGELIVITEDRDNLALHYLVKNPQNVFELSSLPSYPDDEGHVVIMNDRGMILDEVHYYDNWHFTLLRDKEGVSLERISLKQPAAQKDNWQSAASAAGGATPTGLNSQSRNEPAKGVISINPRVISPDNDGIDDFSLVLYQFERAGIMVTVNIFNSYGQVIRRLVRNSLSGTGGNWKWDGLDDKGNQLPSGVYIVLVDTFDLTGKHASYKNSVIIAGKVK